MTGVGGLSSTCQWPSSIKAQRGGDTPRHHTTPLEFRGQILFELYGVGIEDADAVGQFFCGHRIFV